MPKLARSYDANYPEYHASFQYSMAHRQEDKEFVIEVCKKKIPQKERRLQKRKTYSNL